MKTAYKVTPKTGSTLSGITSMKYQDVEPTDGIKISMIDFFVPMAVLVGTTIFYDIDLLRGGCYIYCMFITLCPKKKDDINGVPWCLLWRWD